MPSRRSSCFNATATARIFNGVPAPAVAAICAFSAATLDFCSPVIIANPPRAPPRTPSFAGSGLHVTTGKSEDLRIFNGVPAPAVAAICAFSAATLDFCSPVIIANPPRAPPRTPSFAGSGLHVTTGKSEDLRIVVGQVLQRRGVSRDDRPGGSRRMDRPMNPATYFGTGKVQEIADLRRATTADLVVICAKLSPSQLANLERIIGCWVLDATALR